MLRLSGEIVQSVVRPLQDAQARADLAELWDNRSDNKLDNTSDKPLEHADRDASHAAVVHGKGLSTGAA